MDALPPGAGDRDRHTLPAGSKNFSEAVSAISSTSGPRHWVMWHPDACEPAVKTISGDLARCAPAPQRNARRTRPGPARTRATTDRFAWPIGGRGSSQPRLLPAAARGRGCMLLPIRSCDRASFARPGPLPTPPRGSRTRPLPSRAETPSTVVSTARHAHKHADGWTGWH